MIGCDNPSRLRWGGILEVAMTALVQALSRATRTEIETDALTTVALLCGAGLFVSLLFATYGVDLSPGFF
jgi:hypothetical protein